MPTPAEVEDVLQQMFDAVETGLGSTTYAADVESTFKARFRNTITWKWETVEDDLAMLLIRSQEVGEYAASHLHPGQVGAAQIIKAVEAIALVAYHENGDAPTRYCS